MKATPLLDLFAVESRLTEEQLLVRDSVRAFSRDVFAPRVRKSFIEETFPDDLVPRIGALGVLGANL
ncbi:MAG: acyl-CoA dehydrogenase family protein, partial [Myxococcales bacterium]|nr:acyl-CoA dehydrogenase family protein [Myxococcales bacterium]